jgi:AraC-like DNA-binding protein
MSINLARVKDLIDENICHIHSIKQVAQILDMPVETLRKDFVRRERIPLSRYIVSVRISKAMSLLKATTRTCSEVCYSVGFLREDVGERTFKQVTGVTMQEYRKGALRIDMPIADSAFHFR